MEASETNEAVLQLLEKWRKRARTNQRAHYARAEQLHAYNRALGVPAVLLSTLIGTSIFATLKQDLGLWPRMTFGLTSFAAAVLAALQTFFKFSEQAALHHAAAANYGIVNRKIEAAQAMPPANSVEAERLIKELRDQMDTLPKQAPAIPDKLWLNLRLHLTPDYPFNVPGKPGS